ncbi:unnamed protein product [Lathyrus oleraceus]|uniref:Uncharacterized protein n=1 Tax=Pisum sativum TaxID=3888 RepID=A0A9D5AVL6_PEA|nr:protein SOB FIVE-LIKE 5-like [Pisum sativum]KAI5423548.1 hypothetical protein KIW84_046481 [Pisum sativum]
MDALGSECSSGCESGWTLYLDHSFHTSSQSHTPSLDQTKHKMVQYDEEEDSSMVSDASSGPPHHDYSPSNPAKLAKRSKKRQKVKENNIQQHLDDTASSPLFDNSNVVTINNQQTTSTIESALDYSQGFSATYFEERSSLQDHFGFLQSSLSQNEAHINKKWLLGGKEMGMI